MRWNHQRTRLHALEIGSRTGATHALACLFRAGRPACPQVRRYPTDSASQYWLPNVRGSCDTTYLADFSMPQNSDARLLYFESYSLLPLYNNGAKSPMSAGVALRAGGRGCMPSVLTRARAGILILIHVCCVHVHVRVPHRT